MGKTFLGVVMYPSMISGIDLLHDFDRDSMSTGYWRGDGTISRLHFDCLGFPVLL